MFWQSNYLRVRKRKITNMFLSGKEDYNLHSFHHSNTCFPHRYMIAYLNFDLCISFSVVNSNNRSGHFWNNDHVSQLGLNNIGFLIWWAFLLLLSQFLDQSHWLSFQSTAKLAANSAWEKFHKLFIVHIKQLVEIDSPVSKLPEGTPLLQLSGLQIR